MRAVLRTVATVLLAAFTIPLVASPAAAGPSAGTEIRIEGLTPEAAVTYDPSSPSAVSVSGLIEGVRIDPTTCSFTPTPTGARVSGCADSDLTVDLAYEVLGGETSAVTATVSTGGQAAKTKYTLHCGVVYVVIGWIIYCYVTASAA